MPLTTGLRTTLPTNPNGIRGGGTQILNPFEIVDTLTLPPELPIAAGLTSSGDIYVRRDRLDRDSPVPPYQIPDTL